MYSLSKIFLPEEAVTINIWHHEPGSAQSSPGAGNNEPNSGIRFAAVFYSHPERRPMTPYRVVLADDHALFRGGVRRILEVEVVGEAGDGLAIIEILERPSPLIWWFWISPCPT